MIPGQPASWYNPVNLNIPSRTRAACGKRMGNVMTSIRRHTPPLLAICILANPATAGNLSFKNDALARLVDAVPGILEDYDPVTGHFGKGIWICSDQNVMYPLAVAYATPGPGNKYHKDTKLLEVIMNAGDALIADADAAGQWVFRKKDGSTWGKIHMPWTYSRWARAYSLIKADMPTNRREKWARALTLGYARIERSQFGHVHNIPTHHAMGLYLAGQTLDRPEWCTRASQIMAQVIKAQSEGGFWSEGGGPVISYNFVYVDAVGVYFAASGDKAALEALQRAARYHRHFTYPDGRNVETIDQRNPYHDTVAEANVGFTFTPDGRAYLHNQWLKLGPKKLSTDLCASLLLYGQEGTTEEPESPNRRGEPAGSTKNVEHRLDQRLAKDAPGFEALRQLFVLRDRGTNRAMTVSQGPWFICLSAFTSPLSTSRWIQDRQNLVSIYHEKTGLIIGGGNTKLQPAWSSFTVGDTALLAHKSGDTNPDFEPKGTLFHIPSRITLVDQPSPGLDCTYGQETCTIRVQPHNQRTLVYTVETTTRSALPVAAHLTLLPHLGKTFDTCRGTRHQLGNSPIDLSPEELGGGLTFTGYRLGLPSTASLHWPALPHNPYRKDGRAEVSEGRIEIRIPLDTQHARYDVTVEVGTDQ